MPCHMTSFKRSGGGYMCDEASQPEARRIGRANVKWNNTEYRSLVGYYT
jgi:hypothetical protein